MKQNIKLNQFAGRFIRSLVFVLAGCGLAAASVHAQQYYWDPSGTPTTPSFGSGTWDTASSFWSDLATDHMWPNNATSGAIFGYPGGAVIIATGGVTANNLFLDDAYTISGDVLTLAGASPSVMVNYGNPVISAKIAGSTGLTVVSGTNAVGTALIGQTVGAGNALTLSGNNTYSGETYVTTVAGDTNVSTTLTVGSPTALGDTGYGVTVVGATPTNGAVANGNIVNTLQLAANIGVTNKLLTLDATAGQVQFGYAGTSGVGKWAGPIVVKGTKLLRVNASAGTGVFQLGNSSSDTISNVPGSGTVIYLQGGVGQGVINSTISGDFPQLNENKQTTWTINSTNNSFNGDVYVNSYGKLLFYSIANQGVNSSLGAGTNIVLGILGANTTPLLSWMGSNAVNNAASDRTITLLDSTATGDIIAPNYAGQTLTLNGAITTSNQVSDTLWTRGSGTLVINGSISDNTTKGLAVRGGSGNLCLYSTNNSFRGYMSVEAPVYFLSIANGGVNSSLGAGTNITIHASGLWIFKGTNGVHNGSSDRSIRLTGGNNQIRLQQTGGLVLDLSGTISADTSAIMFIRDTGSMNIRGNIVDTTSSGMKLLQNSSGTITIYSTNNNFFGQVQQQSGTLAFASVANRGVNCSLGAGTTNILFGNSFLSYIGTGTNSTDRVLELIGINQTLSQDGTGFLQWSGNVTNDSGGTGRQFTLSGSVGNGEFDGLIQDQIGNSANPTRLLKLGSNAWTLTAANTYSGTTTVSSGSLLVNGSIGTNAVIVGTGSVATLGGTGTISGQVTFNSGTFAQLTLGSPLTFASSLIITNSGNIPAVSVNLSNNVPVGTYILATYNTTGSSGAFAATPVIASGSIAAGDNGVIVTTGGTVQLQVVVTPATAPTFTSGSVTRLSDGNVSLTATGAYGTPYRLWASTNLALTPITTTWTLLKSDTLTSSPFTFNDLTATNYPQRFYIFSNP